MRGPCTAFDSGRDRSSCLTRANWGGFPGHPGRRGSHTRRGSFAMNWGVRHESERGHHPAAWRFPRSVTMGDSHPEDSQASVCPLQGKTSRERSIPAYSAKCALLGKTLGSSRRYPAVRPGCRARRTGHRYCRFSSRGWCEKSAARPGEPPSQPDSRDRSPRVQLGQSMQGCET